jgi:hypothetical protein
MFQEREGLATKPKGGPLSQETFLANTEQRLLVLLSTQPKPEQVCEGQ